MEFAFNINNLFGDDVSLIDRNLVPYRSTSESWRQRKDELNKVIDEMGKASAQAQGLHGPITSASRMAQSHCHLYIKKDPWANNGSGAVIGFLKVGPKKLFIYDRNGIQREMAPLCLLDFYVCESCQRQGSGKQLFDAMLQYEDIDAVDLAIDRPSPKCLAFLSRHYGLRTTIRQVNNFVVFEGFFRDQQNSHKARKIPETLPDVQSMAAAYSRPPTGNRGGTGPSRPSSGRYNSAQQTKSMAAQHAMYSRHQVASPLVSDGENATRSPTVGGQRDLCRAASPPLLQREGPPSDYLKLTSNSDYMGRRGHLKVGANNPSRSDLPNSLSASDIRVVQRRRQDTAFNIFGVPTHSVRPVNANSSPYPRRAALW